MQLKKNEFEKFLKRFPTKDRFKFFFYLFYCLSFFGLAPNFQTLIR